MSMVSDLWGAMEERHARDIAEWSMDGLRKLAENRHRALIYATYLMMRAQIFEMHGTLIGVPRHLLDRV